jgi:hypothetical protein
MKTKRVLSKLAAISTGVAMVGATMSGALALSSTLADYPAPFITNGVFSGVIALGTGGTDPSGLAEDQLGAISVMTNLQTLAVSPVSGGGTLTVAGGVSEDIPLGESLAPGKTVSNGTVFDQELEDDDLDNFFDGTVTFQSTDYDAKDELLLGQDSNYVSAETSLTSSEDDYQTDIFLETARDAIKYYYVFDETIQLNKTTTTDPLEIKFLGQTLKLTSVDSDSKFTALVGTEYFMDVDDSVEVIGKTITLKNVGSGGAVVIIVDGVQETIPADTTETVNGLEIKNEETFYEDNKGQRSATLVIGKEAQETYKDGDAYIGEDKDDPNWVWDIANLNTNSATTISSLADASTTGPKLGVENDFIWNDDADNPAGVGECADLPNNFVSICLDSLTVADDNYETYTFELDLSADLSDAFGSGSTVGTSTAAIFIHTTKSEGLKVDVDDLNKNGTQSKDWETDKIWVASINNAGTQAGADAWVYYEDSDGKVQLAGSVSSLGSGGTQIEVNNDNTKGTDVQIEVFNSSGTLWNLIVIPFESTDLPAYDDNITMNWTLASNALTSLGATVSSEEAGELSWRGQAGLAEVNLGTKDEDHRTKYGIIVRDPKAHGASDEVVMEIPGDQVQGNVVIKGVAATKVAASGSVKVNPIPSTVIALDREVSDPTADNLIVVGGPAVNSLARSVFGLVPADFTPNEAMVKLVDNGNNVAMLVAGYAAVDTRNAADAIATGKLKGIAQAEATVTTTRLNEYTVA